MASATPGARTDRVAQNHAASMSSAHNVARLHDVTHRYGKTTAVESFALQLPAGRLIGFIGPDGVGKSTVLALISGVRKIQSGRVEVLGKDISGARTRAALCARIAYMPQGLGKNLTAGKTELFEESLHPGNTFTLVRVDLGVASFKVCVGQDGGRPVPRTRDEDCVQVVFVDQAIEVNVSEALAGVRVPMAEQAGLCLFQSKWLAEQRVLLEVKHPEAQVKAGAPVGVNLAQLVRGEPRPFDRRIGLDRTLISLTSFRRKRPPPTFLRMFSWPSHLP